MNKKSLNLLKKAIRIIIGTFLMAVAYKSVFETSGLVTGGFSGIGIIVRKITGIQMWVTNIALNAPLFIAAWHIKGKDFVKITAVSTALLTFFLAVLPEINFDETDLLLAAVYGGVLCGGGIALVLTSGATTGGTDMLATVLNKLVPQYGVVRIMQMLDAVIVILGMAVFGVYRSLYAMVAIYVTTFVCDRVVDGLKFAKCLVIISDKAREISDNVMNYLGRGVTGLEGEGMYSAKRKKVLYCIVSRKESVKLKEIVNETDPDAFVIISDVREVMGEGFGHNY